MRLGNTKQAVVLIGEKTQSLYRFVRWELEMCLQLKVPMVAVNLNGGRCMDPDRCPPILRGEYVAHVAFKMAIIRFALDNFPDEYAARDLRAPGDRFYDDAVYESLGIVGS
jgi:hypothetical protein